MSIIDNYNNIPYEIWYKIIQHLSQNDLFQCQKVCKSWYLSTRQYFWESIELVTVDNVELFLNNFPKDAIEFVKNITIQDPYIYCDDENYIPAIQQQKNLLLNLSNIEKIYIADIYTKSLTDELSNDEFLIKFLNKCSNIQLFKIQYNHQISYYEEYNKIIYSLRNTLTNIIIEEKQQSIYDQIIFFPQLEHLTLICISDTFLEFLYKIKMLKQLKYLYINSPLDFENNIEMDTGSILSIIEKDQILKERLASLEKLRLTFHVTANKDNSLYTNIVMQHFIGLKEIDIYFDGYHDSNSEDGFFSNEWIDFIFSHDNYNMKMIDFNIYDYVNIITMYLKNHFKQHSTENKKVTNHLRLTLGCIDYNRLNSSDLATTVNELGKEFTIQFKSKEIDNNQFLKLANIYLMDSESTLGYLYKILNSEKYIIEDMNTLTFEFVDEFKYYEMIDTEKRYFAAHNTLRLTDQILSLATDVLKKVIIITESYCKWSKYFAKYEKVKTYRQVIHLEIYVCTDDGTDDVSGELLDELTLSQIVMVFPCIKYLTLEYFLYQYSYDIPNNNQVFINLPQTDLKKLKLDASILESIVLETAKTQKNFVNTYFMLKVEANKKSYQYQISLDSLKVTKIVKDNREMNIKSLQVHIILKNIECLELYYISEYIPDKEYMQIIRDTFISKVKTNKKNLCERRIYFE